MLEAIFDLASPKLLKESKTKYNHVVAHLPLEITTVVAMEVSRNAFRPAPTKKLAAGEVIIYSSDEIASRHLFRRGTNSGMSFLVNSVSLVDSGVKVNSNRESRHERVTRMDYIHPQRIRTLVMCER
ncbi:hypothetical protein NPIL_499011 [Nephila pilipes]|uniref:Uncharacterized protein n=1 Tax=Nephila pilipes TaxID=299642 RepID=A0A8X6UXL6_NEPPI|nr:hypothetical protein NPIL_499011 [Nephila pilipes]